MSCKGLTQSKNTLIQLQLFITSKVSYSLTHIRSRQNVGPDLGPNYLNGLPADDNNMLRFNAKLKYIGSISPLITSKVFNSLDPYQVRRDAGLILV